MAEIDLDRELELKRYIDRTQLQRLAGLSWSSIRKIKDFPKPRLVGRSYRWSLAEVVAYLAARPTSK